MPLGPESLRLAIAGAASLRGKDLKLSLEESGFPAGEILLLDEDLAVGTLTDVAGEPAVIQSIDDASFEGLRFVFFTGSPEFAAVHAPAATRAGATIIDLTGGLGRTPGAHLWIPRLDPALLPPPLSASPAAAANIYRSPSAPAIVACSLAAALAELSLLRLVIVFLRPVSERGQVGVDELEGQTVKLLSLQPIAQDVFGAQVAFNLLDRWGSSSSERFSAVRSAVAAEVTAYLAGRLPLPAITLVQAPVFFADAFAAYAEFAAPPEGAALLARLETAGFKLTDDENPASNMSAAGESQPLVTVPEPDDNAKSGCWLWGAADNLRLATANAVRIAERILAS